MRDPMGDIVSRCRPAMGTFVEVTVRDSGAVRGVAITAAFAAIDRVATLMSFHDPSSDLSRLNAGGDGGLVRVDAWTMAVLRLANSLYVATDGHFDCTVGFDLVVAGLLPRHADARVAHARIDAGREHPTFADVVLLDEHHVRFRRPLCLDLGGIAKGFAVDRAIDALSGRGVESAVVNAGGDLRVVGCIPVPIHVRLKESPRQLRYAGDLADGAFATSTSRRTGLADPCLAPAALIRPMGRRVIASRATYSIVAPTCGVADGLTKALASTGGLSPLCLQTFGATQLIH